MLERKTLAKIGADLKLGPGRLEDAIRKKHAKLVSGFGGPYLRFHDKIGNVEQGTVVFIRSNGKEDALEYLAGFPKIRRALVLGSALKNCLGESFVVEEKMNGYNVRVAKVFGEIFAVTRGGVVCPYTTERLRRIFENKKAAGFFEKNPSLMLCCEVVGLMNPYQMKGYPEATGFGYFVFDVRDRRTGRPASVSGRAALLEKYGLRGVRSFGKFSAQDGKKLLGIVRGLGEDGREGVVLKSADMKRQVKYTSNQSTNEDLAYAFGFVFDYGQPFFFRRIVREAFQAYELGLSKQELEKEAGELGKAILLPMVETIRAIAQGKEVTEDFDIKVPSIEFGEFFVEHLRHLGVKATVEKVSEESDGFVIRVKRHYQATNDKTKAYLEGDFCGE